MAITTSEDTSTPQIDFVPEENVEALQGQIAAWIRANAFMGMTDYTRSSLQAGHLGSLSFGGNVSLPDGSSVESHASLTVELWPSFKRDRVEDPDGTRWSRNRIAVKVQSPGHSMQTVAQARLRLAIFEAVIVLAERLEAQFGHDVVWRKDSTRAERETYAAALRRDGMQRLVAGAVALECAGMRKGSERMAVTPPGVDKATYDVERADKAYRAFVTNDKRFKFVRTK